MGPGGTEISVNINPSSPKLLLLKKLTAATGKGTNKAGYRGELGKPIREFTEAGDRDKGTSLLQHPGVLLSWGKILSYLPIKS